jgi:hypothetical protein
MLEGKTLMNQIQTTTVDSLSTDKIKWKKEYHKWRRSSSYFTQTITKKKNTTHEYNMQQLWDTEDQT